MTKKDFTKKPIEKKPSDTEERPARPINQKKILYLEIDDEVTSVFDRMKQLKMNDVYLVVPKQAILLQSLVNLKILKSHAERAGKNIALVTNDSNGIHLAQQVGLPVYDRIDQKGRPYIARLPEREEISISPLKASINSIEDETPTRLKEPKYSIPEFLGRIRKKSFPLLEIARIQKKKTAPQKEVKEPKLVLVAPNKQALISLIAVSLVILLSIAYIALPGATIYITPKATALEQSVNITLADFETNKTDIDARTPNMIASHPILTTITRTMMYASTGNIFQGENAKGMVTVINLSPNVWPLIPKTRFRTADGIVYRMQSYLNVPAARGTTPGTVDVEVTADPFDIYDQAVGARGNIGSTRFFLPGLSAENQKRLYAESKTGMNGGKTIVKKEVTKEDIEAAKSKMKDELLKSVEAELEKSVLEKDSLLNEKKKFKILKGKLAFHIGEPGITIPPDIEGKEIEQFEVTGSLNVSGVYYNEDELYEILATQLKLKKSPLKRIVKVDRDTITYRIFDVDENTKKMKITATIKGIEEFDINTRKEYGERLVEKIKEHIVGRKVDDAKEYIRNLPEIKTVEIKSWPAWAPTVPGVPDNIKVEVVRDTL